METTIFRCHVSFREGTLQAYRYDSEKIKTAKKSCEKNISTAIFCQSEVVDIRAGTPSNKKNDLQAMMVFFPLKIKDFPLKIMLVDNIWSRNLDQYSFLWVKVEGIQTYRRIEKVSFPHGGIELKKSHWKLSQSLVYKPML